LAYYHATYITRAARNENLHMGRKNYTQIKWQL
jgi:hypothetical protein